MKILLLLLTLPKDSKSSSMYLDLAKEFRDNGHQVTIMAPDRHYCMGEEFGMSVIRVRSNPVLGVNNMIKKGVGLALLPYDFKRAYTRYLKKEQFDWIFMPTPPITLVDFVFYVKQKTNARFYLILRDIHPESAASIGLIKYRFMYDYLVRKALKGYRMANIIGCMSQGNINFVAKRYPAVNRFKFVLLMNWQKESEIVETSIDVREKYNLQDKYIVLFGGNIGLGQRIENIVSLARHYKSNPDIVFLIIGKGVKRDELEKISILEDLHNIQFVNYMPRNEYMDFVKSVDLGLISINENYSVPTCPSKAISYMSLKIPIMAIINPYSDYGNIIENAGAGYWAIGGDTNRIFSLFDKLFQDAALRKRMGENGFKFYMENLTSAQAYKNIMNQIN